MSLRSQGEGMGREAILTKYSRLAKEYDTRWSFYVEATTRETVRRLLIDDKIEILDVACGTGILLGILSSTHAVTPTGVDASPEMLQMAQVKLKGAARLVRGWATDLPFRSNRFDMVLCVNAFHYVRDPRRALAEFARVLKPNGRLVITDWCDDYLTCKICDLFLRVFSRSHFRTYDQSECQRLLERHGFKEVRVERYKINWIWGVVTATAEKSAV
jgi:ubiquinone/menaquinone biosynthesis C-methylase UbiE